MNTSIITTNVRVPETQYQLSKMVATEMGKSFNEYVNDVLIEDAQRRQLFDTSNVSEKSKYKKIKFAFKDLCNIAKGAKRENFEMSENDRIIYDL